MYLSQDHPDFERAIVFLNGKLCSVVAANEEEGWVDIIDIQSMAPLDLTEQGAAKPGQEEDLNEWEELPLKRVHGKVSIKIIP